MRREPVGFVFENLCAYAGYYSAGRAKFFPSGLPCQLVQLQENHQVQLEVRAFTGVTNSDIGEYITLSLIPT